MKLVSAYTSPRYKDFVRQRNVALERIHDRAQLEISDIVSRFLNKVLETISHRYARLQAHGQYSPQGRQILASIDAMIDLAIIAAAPKIEAVQIRMRRNVYLLSYAGEAEALARARGRPQKVAVTKNHLHLVGAQESPAGGRLHIRVEYYLAKLKRKVHDAVHLALILEEDLAAADKRILAVFPELIRKKKRGRILRPFREAVVGPQGGVKANLFGFLDDDQWDDMVDTYKTDYLPQTRGPNSVYDVTDEEGDTQEVYGWELEKDLTQDFVQNVRDGQVDAANENGITDFVWIAVLDDKTDTCCRWRHGLTSSEIQEQLDGKRSEDECQVIVPPAHFWCRCDIAPMLADMPEETPADQGDFEEWLKAA